MLPGGVFMPDMDPCVAPFPFMVFPSLPNIEGVAEVGMALAELKLYNEPMLTRLPASASEKDERLLINEGSGKERFCGGGESG